MRYGRLKQGVNGMPDYFYDTDEFTFVWDEDKNNLNIRKHGIPFTVAAYLCPPCDDAGTKCL